MRVFFAQGYEFSLKRPRRSCRTTRFRYIWREIDRFFLTFETTSWFSSSFSPVSDDPGTWHAWMNDFYLVHVAKLVKSGWFLTCHVRSSHFITPLTECLIYLGWLSPSIRPSRFSSRDSLRNDRSFVSSVSRTLISSDRNLPFDAPNERIWRFIFLIYLTIIICEMILSIIFNRKQQHLGEQALFYRSVSRSIFFFFFMLLHRYLLRTYRSNFLYSSIILFFIYIYIYNVEIDSSRA